MTLLHDVRASRAPERRVLARVLWCCALCMIAVAAAAAPPPAATNPLHEMSAAFEALAGRVSPAVVEILVSGYGPADDQEENPAAPIGRESSQGSGVIVDPDGYIVTNYHVVAGAQRIRVVITPPERDQQARAELVNHPRILPAEVVGISKLADLAVLKVDASGLPTIPFANYRRLRQGQVVLAVGSPIGLKNSVSLGLVSSVLRQTSPGSPMVYIGIEPRYV